MKKFTLVFGLTTFVLASLAAESAKAACGTVEVAKGNVQIESGSTKKAAAAAVGAKICAGDTIIAGPDSRAKLKMEDGNELNISPDSKINLETYQFVPAENKKKVLLNILQGKVRASTKQENMYNDKSRDGAENTFQVKTKSAVAGVRGTDFLTGFDPKTAKTEVVTFKGKVEFGQPGPGGTITNGVQVGAGQKTDVAPGQPPAPPRAVPPKELQQMNSSTKAETGGSASTGPTDKATGNDKDKNSEKDKGDKKADGNGDKKADGGNEKKPEAGDGKGDKQAGGKNEPRGENQGSPGPGAGGDSAGNAGPAAGPGGSPEGGTTAGPNSPSSGSEPIAGGPTTGPGGAPDVGGTPEVGGGPEPAAGGPAPVAGGPTSGPAPGGPAPIGSPTGGETRMPTSTMPPMGGGSMISTGDLGGAVDFVKTPTIGALPPTPSLPPPMAILTPLPVTQLPTIPVCQQCMDATRPTGPTHLTVIIKPPAP